MAFGIKALADDGGHTMNAGYLRVAMALWIVALVAGGYAESYPNRPTAGELDDIVVQGTECMLGVNERCLATQYATNPVSYQVSPPFVKTNDAGWYLDQNAMGIMASTIRSLVPYYVDTNTVYDGTTNIAMLTVTGLWARLEIGDHTNQFTCTPAIGTNAATYGDNPWRICATNLQERYKVLNALKVTARYLAVTNEEIKWANANTYGDAVSEWALTDFTTNATPFVPGEGRYLNCLYNYIDNVGGGPWDIIKQRGRIVVSECTNVSVRIEYWVKMGRMNWVTPEYFLSYENYSDEGTYSPIYTSLVPVFVSDLLHNDPDVIPNPGYGGTWGESWHTVDPKLICFWNFNYCTNKYW